MLATIEVDTCRYPELGPCVGGRAEISFVDATGQGRRVPDPLQVDAVGSNQVLGWTASNEVAVLTESKLTNTDPDPGTYWVTVVPLGGGDPRNLSAIPGSSNFGVGRFQLASALLPALDVRAASGTIDRGPWPLPLRAAVVLFTGIAVAAMAKVAAGGRLRSKAMLLTLPSRSRTAAIE